MNITIRYEHDNFYDAIEDSDIKNKYNFVGKIIYSKKIYFKSSNSNLNRKFNENWFIAQTNSNKVEEKDFKINYQVNLPKCLNFPFKLEPRDKQKQNIQAEKYNLIIYGDSQPRGMCKRLKKRLDLVVSKTAYTEIYPNIAVSVQCVKKKGPITADFEEYKLFYLNFLNESIKSPYKKIYYINFSGLWDAAYGCLGAKNKKNTNTYRREIKILLNLTIEFLRTNIKTTKIYLMTTTRVEPILFTELKSHKSKFQMTQPRVEYLNKVLVEEFEHSVLHKPDIEGLLNMIDTGSLSKFSLTDAPANDMRHLSAHTNDILLDYVVCTTFYSKISLI